MREITFTVPSKPYGKKRPRFGGGRAYNPKENSEYEKMVRSAYLAAAGGATPGRGPFAVRIKAVMPIPQRTAKKDLQKIKSGDVLPAKKPDWDNIGKAICDALNGIAYIDDSQIVWGSVIKVYGDVPEVIVTVKELGKETL